MKFVTILTLLVLSFTFTEAVTVPMVEHEEEILQIIDQLMDKRFIQDEKEDIYNAFQKRDNSEY